MSARNLTCTAPVAGLARLTTARRDSVGVARASPAAPRPLPMAVLQFVAALCFASPNPAVRFAKRLALIVASLTGHILPIQSWHPKVDCVGRRRPDSSLWRCGENACLNQRRPLRLRSVTGRPEVADARAADRLGMPAISGAGVACLSGVLLPRAVAAPAKVCSNVHWFPSQWADGAWLDLGP